MNYIEFFKLAKEKNISNIQIVEKKTTDSSVELINGKIESYNDYDNIDYEIKAEYNKKTVKIHTNYLDKNIINLIIFKCKNTDSVYEDEYLKNIANIEKNEEIEFDITKEIEILKNLDSYRKKYKDIDKLTTYFSETYSNTRIINSNGVDISTDSHLCAFMIEVIIKNKGKYTSYDEKVLSTDKKEIDFEKLTKEVIEKALLNRHKEKIETRKYNIILDKRVASRIVNSFNDMLSASSIRNKISCLEDKLEKQLFSTKLNIIEDPTNKKYPGYRLFDNEGTKTEKKSIINKGKIKTYLYNIKEAKLVNKKSTGNGYESISTRNMYIIPGKLSEKELLEKLDNGIYIADYMESGGTSINSINGDISLQIFGFLVENGKLKTGIEPSIMTTNIFELLTNIEEIASNLQFTSTISASPSILIRDISIAR